mmetsp:Transcript_102833/g.245107  ORF Transcript_102833/g.245107 Transcript_102833/m.245107 type:complete len:81 (-) Transcript_102833:36-278(-)
MPGREGSKCYLCLSESLIVKVMERTSKKGPAQFCLCKACVIWRGRKSVSRAARAVDLPLWIGDVQRALHKALAKTGYVSK